jgi:hypothetical protein
VLVTAALVAVGGPPRGSDPGEVSSDAATSMSAADDSAAPPGTQDPSVAPTTGASDADAGPAPSPRPVPSQVPDGLWLSSAEIAGLPTSGRAWDRMVEVADEKLKNKTDIARRDEHNIRTLAAALVGERLDDDDYRDKALDGIERIVERDPDDDLLAASRRLVTYVVAADVLDLRTLDPSLDRRFRAWLQEMLEHDFEERRFGSTIVAVHERRPNNWGTHAGASRIAIAAYLGDRDELDDAATVFRGWLGDRSAYRRFDFGSLDWQADPREPVGINPAGATLDGRSVDGVVPDDQRRGGDVRWPPPKENYVWEALQGAVVQAQLLHRQGYDAWAWEDDALLRATTWLYEQADYPPEGDDEWIPWLVNHAYGTDLPVELGTRPGKGMGFTDWSHAMPASLADELSGGG